jgi:hypothetical protein
MYYYRVIIVEILTAVERGEEREKKLGEESFNLFIIRFDNQSGYNFQQKSVVICCFFTIVFLKY